MKWQPVTAIYIIGNRYPIATFLHENQAEEWAEANYPGEWVKKGIKIPNLPVTPKSATRKPKSLKDLAERLANLDWSAEDEEEEGDGVSVEGPEQEEKKDLKDVAAQLSQMDWDAGEKEPEDGADDMKDPNASFDEFADEPDEAPPPIAPQPVAPQPVKPEPAAAPQDLAMPEFIDEEDDDASFGSEFDDDPEDLPKPPANDLFT